MSPEPAKQSTEPRGLRPEDKTLPGSGLKTPASGLSIVAHRGASFDAPENTLSAFRLAWQQGADVIEGDYHVTADGQVVCTHDETTKRCGDRELTIAASTLAELRALDVGRWKNPAFENERMPTLAEVLATVPAGKSVFIELKTSTPTLPVLFKAIADAGFPFDRLRLISFDADVIALAKKTLPQIAADWLVHYDDGIIPVQDLIVTLKSCKADGLGTEARPDVVTPAFGDALRAAGYSLRCWTVNDEPTARAMIAAGVEAITTDKPGWLRKVLEGVTP